MPLPVAHALVGGSVALLAWPDRSPAGRRKALFAGAALGVCPDLDYLINAIGVWGRGWHHGFTHSLLFAMVVGCAVSLLIGQRSWKGMLACTLALLSHPVLDYLLTESRGVALAWPFTDHRYKLGNEALNYYHLGGLSREQPWLGLLRLSAWEILAGGPLLTAALTFVRTRYRNEPRDDR